MLKNYLKSGIRNLLKNKFFSLINISSLAISIASFGLISLYIWDELKYDKHIDKVDSKYRVFNELFTDDGRTWKGAMVPPMIAPTLAAEYPEVESYFRFLNFNSPILFEAGGKKMIEDGGGFADPSVFEMFSLTLLEGDLKTALTHPNAVAINRTLKQKYFGDKPALNETMEVNDTNYKVTAVFEDFPAHSHLQLNYFLAMEGFIRENPDRMQRWGWSQFHTYVKLTPGTDAAQLEGKLKGFAERNAWPETKLNGSYYIPHLMPVEKIHLYASDQSWDIAIRGNIQTLYILSGTAVFILVIAILNFINLSTARATSRIKEVGVRKVVGAARSQLINQFMFESFLLIFIALLVGSVMTHLIVPVLNSFAEKNISRAILFDPLIVMITIGFTLLIAVGAGAYPAFFISKYKPVQILSSHQSPQSGKFLLRKGLVVFQFVLSFFLIIASLVVSKQNTYLRTKDMGFDKDNLLVIKIRGEIANNLEAAKNAFSNHPNIISSTMGYGLPGQAYAGDGIVDKKTNKEWPISMLTVDHDYANTLSLEFIAGRNFSKDFPSDEHSAFILSESAAKMLGYTDPQQALQHELSWSRWDAPDSLKEGKVIGIVKDFHLNSLHENISPVVLHIYPFAYSTIAFRIKPENFSETLTHLQSTWKEFNSEWPMEYKFLDENFERLYRAEAKLDTLFRFFTAFTIFVACLGLFGLVVYNTALKYKEISIRKVLGARESTLVIHLAKSYFLLIGIAFIIAAPLSYFAADKWLQKFAFHIQLNLELFVSAALIIIVIAFVTVVLQAFKAARANPVDALKE